MDVQQVQTLISAGQLKVLDTFVADRAFEDFCKKHGHEFNLDLMDPATARWLVKEYEIAQTPTESKLISRAQKHALVVRTCTCGRKIAGNVYFKHIKCCVIAAQASRGKTSKYDVEPACGQSLDVST